MLLDQTILQIFTYNYDPHPQCSSFITGPAAPVPDFLKDQFYPQQEHMKPGLKFFCLLLLLFLLL